MTDLLELIGPYKILEKLGEGGFATVYLAQAADRDDVQQVALKVLNSDHGYRRFQREVETVAKLEHPNIVRIFDTGEDERLGTPYFAMEYIPGGTLRDRLETDTCLPLDEAVALVKQVGSALTYAHQQGIIHRDVNPNNILLDTVQTPIRPVLTDFGLVKPLVPDEDMTMTVGIIGTFHYYAPEQWNREQLTPATDLYALAITFFEIVAGQRPFKGDIFSLREKHLDEPLPSLTTLVDGINSSFEDVLIKATAKDPRDRYETVAQFVEALEAANNRAKFDVEYEKIRSLIDRGEQTQALERLHGQFIRPGNYEYRDVAKLFWELVYAKQHEGAFPPGTRDMLNVQQYMTEPVANIEDVPEQPQAEADRQKLKRQREISKYIIPVALGLAVITGGIITPQIPALLKRPEAQILALALLIAYLFYYAWTYYFSQASNE